MPSPFPGMNPWLEKPGSWPDFHTSYLMAIKEIVVSRVRPKYVVILEQHVYIHELELNPPRFVGRADLLVARSSLEGEGSIGVAVAEAPAEVQIADLDIERIPYLEIRDREGRDLIAVLEMLSPSNKRGDDRNQYLARRKEILSGPAHLVEIDLLRGGRPMPEANRPACAYSVLVSRAEDRPRAGFWPIGLRDRLPTIPIPLRHPDADARLDLQEALHRVYDAYGYEDFIYTSPPDPPLSTDDAAWARTLVPAAT